jgi:four helix bundle protein
VSQLRRASVSIPSNIAEGYGRYSSKDRRRFTILARGSASEVETQLIIAKELGFVSSEELGGIEDLLSEILKMLVGLSKSLGR